MRNAPDSVARPSSPPIARESFIRKKPSALERALDRYATERDDTLLEAFPEDALDAALRIRLAIHGPAVVELFGPVMVPVVRGMLRDRHGVEIAAEVAALHPDVSYIAPLINVALEAEMTHRMAATDALLACKVLARTELSDLRERVCDCRTIRQWRLRGISLLARLGDPQSLRPFISLLADSDRPVGRSAHAALRELTCHDLGTMRSAWSRWADKHAHRQRIDWLIEALADRRADLRNQALAELTAITGETFGLHQDAPRDAFIDAQSQFSAWRLQSSESS